MKKKVVIIGSGVIGLFTAYYLSEEGHEVILIDKNPDGSEENCSARNAGMLVPSHFVPLASPGIIAQGLRWMLNPKSPFYVNPQINSGFFKWIVRFWLSSTKEHVQRSAPAILDCNLYSLGLYEELSRQLNFQFKQQGLLMICNSEKGMHEEVAAAKTANELGLKTEVMGPHRLKEFEPDINIQATGAVLYPGDAQLDPGLLLNELKATLYKNKNVTLLYNKAITGFRAKNGTVASVLCSDNDMISGDEFILSAGALSSSLGKMMDLNLPMLAGKGYSITVPKQAQNIRTPSILSEARVAVTSFENDIRFGGTMELGTTDHKINPLRIDGIIGSAKKYFPGFDTAELKKAAPWAGHRPCSPDGLPYLGRSSKYKNLVAATGHSMMGLSMAPATGKIVADIIAGKKPVICIDAFSPDRYK